jgi:hypothetical protein
LIPFVTTRCLSGGDVGFERGDTFVGCFPTREDETHGLEAAVGFRVRMSDVDKELWINAKIKRNIFHEIR